MTKIWPIPAIEERSFSEIKERRKVALVTTTAAWDAVESRLHLPIVWKTEMTEATLPSWKELLEEFMKAK